MRKVLVVGLGGSGAKTLSLMMDELLAELKSNYSYEGDFLPKCWKFISIDVPQVAASLGGKLAKPIDQKGGKYRGLAEGADIKTSTYAKMVDRKFDQAHDPSNGHYAKQEEVRWRPTDAFCDTVDPTGGAGAYRAIGRIMTLANSQKTYDFLKAEVVDLMASDSAGVELADMLGTTWQAGQSPLILIVSSMAGGSGASMLIDIADLLNALTAEVPGFKGDQSAAFVYTPEVFGNIDSVAISGGGIALATISELLSVRSMGTAPWSDSYTTWKTLLPTLQVPDRAITSGRGPSLTFPIGATTGGVPFGSTPEDVYRGFARVLTPLLTDEKQQFEFHEYVTVNYPKHLMGEAKDNTGLASPVKARGADVQRHPVFFGGFGSSKLGTGRARYREYAAQLIARQAVETLVNGFASNSGIEANPATLKAKAAESFAPHFFAQVNLDGRNSSESTFTVPNVLAKVTADRSEIERIAVDQISKLTPVMSEDGKTSANAVARNWTSEENNRVQLAKGVAHKALELWASQTLNNIEKAYVTALSVYGIEVGELLLGHLSKSLQALQAITPTAPAFHEEAKTQVNNFLRSMSTAAKVNWGSHRANLDKYLTEIIVGMVKNEAALLMRDLLGELAGPVLDRLKKAGQNLLAELQAELSALPEVISTAAYREAPVNQWPNPKSDHVPSYFEPAVNEVLLTKTDTFLATFKEHLAIETGRDINKFDESIKEAATRVILRAEVPAPGTPLSFFTTWDHTVLNNNVHPHVVRTYEWKPTRISNPPELPVFELKLGTADLRNYANKFIGVNKSAFDSYAKMPLSEWLRQSPSNELALKQLLEDAINFAKPLVTIDPGAARFFHGANHEAKLEFVFSKLPFAANSVAVTQLTANKSQQFKQAVDDACDPAADRTEITIFSRFDNFFYPWAMESLTAPIRKAYETLRTKENLKAFWQAQRSRTLPQALPVGQDVINAMLRGYFIGRITGRVQTEGATVKIFVQPDNSQPGRWVEFAKDLLGDKELGIRNGGDSTDKLNVPAVLLESLPLALVKVYGGSTESMTPYLELFRLGKNLKLNGYGVRTESKTELDEWFVGGSEFTPATKSAPGTDELKAEAEKILRTWGVRAQEHWDKPINESNFYDFEIFGELAPNIIAACGELIQELNRTEPKLGEFTSTEARAVAEVFAVPASTDEDIY